MQSFFKFNIKKLLFSTLLLSGCTYQKHSPLKDECLINSTTSYGKALLDEARRVSNNPNTHVFGNCQEIEELNSEKRKNLTYWRYTIPIEEAKTLNIEDLQLNPSIKG